MIDGITLGGMGHNGPRGGVYDAKPLPSKEKMIGGVGALI